MTVGKPSAPAAHTAAAMRAAADQAKYDQLAKMNGAPLSQQQTAYQDLLEQQYAMAIAAAPQAAPPVAAYDVQVGQGVGDKFNWAFSLAKLNFANIKWRLNYFGKDNTSCSLIGGDKCEPILLANEASAVGQAWDANDLNDEMRKAWLMSEIQARVGEQEPNYVGVITETKGMVFKKIKPITTPVKGGAGFRGLADLLDKNDRQEITSKLVTEQARQSLFAKYLKK